MTAGRGGYGVGMEIVVLILLICGLVCFLAAAFLPGQPGRPAPVPLGLAFWIIVAIIDAANRLHA